ncbi:MAG: hypothetical protein ABFD89_01005 [Bryobacteraceae bacterium]
MSTNSIPQSSTALAPQAGAIARREFGAEQSQAVAETAATAVASREQSQINARYIVAERHPRSMEDVRVRLLHECERSGFSLCARYRKPVGKRQNDNGQWEQQYAEGWSIRFAEAAIRCMTNIYPDSCIVYEGDDLRIMRYSITDLESNLTYSNEVSIKKTVEKKSLRRGQEALSQRTNSNGDTTYTVAATDDELQMKQNSAWSKFIRNGLRFVPGDILDECERKVRETLRSQDEQDPDAAKRRMIDAFAEQGVGPVDLQAFLGKPLDRIHPSEIAKLRGIYTAVKDGDTTWAEVMEEAAAQGTAAQSEEAAQRKIAELKQAASKDEALNVADAPAPEAPVSDNGPKQGKFQMGRKS